MGNDYVTTVEGTLEPKLECNEYHTANSFQEALALIDVCNDFVFFPIESLSHDIKFNIENTIKLFEDINLKWDYSDCKYISKDDCYPKIQSHKLRRVLVANAEEFNDEAKEYLIKDYGNDNGISLYKTFVNILNSFKDELRNTDMFNNGVVYGHFNFSPDSSKTNESALWHVDGDENHDGSKNLRSKTIMLYFTSPGTDFCQIPDHYNDFKTLGKSEKLELDIMCDDQIRESGFYPYLDEGVLFKPTSAYHRSPQYDKTRAYFRITVQSRV